MNTTRPRAARAGRLLAAFVLGSGMILSAQAIHVSASAAGITWVDGGDDSPCLNDDSGRALDALPADQFCTPIPGCYQGDDGKWVLPSRKTGIWQGNASEVRYADEAAATPTPAPSAPKPTTPKPATPKPTTPKATPKAGTPTKAAPTTAAPGAATDLAVDENEVAATGAPTAPAAPVLSVDGSDVTVTWAPAADAALESVTGYEVQISGAVAVVVDATATTKVFADLKDGTYRAAVRAVNAAGTSVSSPPSEPITVGKSVADVKGAVTVDGDLAPGASVVLTGTGYAADVPELTIELHSDPVVLGAVATDAAGAFKTTVTIPAEVPQGQHSLVVLHEGVEVTSTTVEVAPVAVETAAASVDTEDAVTVPPYTGLAILAVLGVLGAGSLVWHVSTGSRRRNRVRTFSGTAGAPLTPNAGVS